MEQNIKKNLFKFRFSSLKNESFPVSCPPSILEGSAQAWLCRPGAEGEGGMEAATGGVQKGGRGGGRKGCPADPQPADQKNPKLLKKKNKRKQTKKSCKKKKKFWFIFWGEGCRDKQLWFGAGAGGRTAFRSVFFGLVFVLVVSNPLCRSVRCGGSGLQPRVPASPAWAGPSRSGDRDSVRVTFDAVTPSTVRQPPSFLPAHPNKI